MEQEWTPEAEEILKIFFDRHRATLCPQGADLAEVHENIRQHVREDAAASGAKLITVERLNRSLSGLVPEPDLDADPAPAAPPSREPAMLRRGTGDRPEPLSFFFLLCGVILPAITILIELVTRCCAETLFDPMPTLWHTALVILVPVANLLIYRAPQERPPRHRRLLAVLCGVALVTSLYYTIAFLTVSVPGFIGIIFFGFGLLPLTPLIAFLATLRGGFKLAEIASDVETETRCTPVLATGITLGLLGLFVLDGPKYFTRDALHRAVEGDAAEQAKAVRQLRSFGSRDILLRACYESSWRSTGSVDTSGWLMNQWMAKSVNPAHARRLYFQVTGTPFNQVEPPRLHSRTNPDFLGDFTFDSDQGGDAVGLRLAHLHLRNSRLDSHIDADSALAYTEWTLVFNNLGRREAEARFQALLPPGGVVSRLTLWVNGEPQEAAFSSNAKVKAAYKNVVKVQRRDPVLVTSTGPDRVLVQCFPVPRRGGEIKIRLGITSPLQPESAKPGSGSSWMPRIIERNFNIAEGFGHSLWVQSAAELSSALPDLVPETGEGKMTHALSGTLTNPELDGHASYISAAGIDADKPVWTEDPFDPGTRIVRRSSPSEVRPYDHLVVVLDTSAGMDEGWEQTKADIATAARAHPITLVLADDKITKHVGQADIGAALSRLEARGGKDNATALLDALAVARSQDNSAVVWVHADQPVMLADTERVLQTLERSLGTRPIFNFATRQETDVTTATIHRIAKIHAAPRRVGLASYLEQLATSGARTGTEPQFEKLPADEPTPAGATKVWDHLARYWAFTETMREYHRREQAAIPAEAAALAAKYQLVTPYSGAVVLETKRDFEQAGLDQVDPDSTPNIPTTPEPSSTSLLMIALATLALRRRR